VRASGAYDDKADAHAPLDGPADVPVGGGGHRHASQALPALV
jgi:hypothetical protein